MAEAWEAARAEQLRQREEMLAAEEQQRKALMASSAEDSSKKQEQMARLAAEREKLIAMGDDGMIAIGE